MTAYQERPKITPELAREWDLLLADFIWWFNGFQAVASRRQRQTMPDLGALRRLRENIGRIAEGRAPLDPPPMF